MGGRRGCDRDDGVNSRQEHQFKKNSTELSYSALDKLEGWLGGGEKKGGDKPVKEFVLVFEWQARGNKKVTSSLSRKAQVSLSQLVLWLAPPRTTRLAEIVKW